jgi:uncharacterized membrane-anchored protein YitT (DUF2179 family)/predicted metal-dependent HD superfamily phosphohydrolase
MELDRACAYILNKLAKELPDHLCYHNVGHTKDVYTVAMELAEGENITDHEKKLLLTAACFHDTGFLELTTGHETVSCRLANEILLDFGYKPDEIEEICSIIMATKIPQEPKSHAGEILSDADLDYLGRDDFLSVSDKLFSELSFLGVVSSYHDWNKIQVAFMESHRYFTKTSRALREAKKDENLKRIKAKLQFRTMKKLALPSRLSDALYTITGVLFSGFALKSFLIPNLFFDGGVTGISLLIHELYKFNIAYVIVLANVPFIIAGAFQVNRAFAFKTLAAVICLGLCLQFIPYPEITSDKLLVSIFGGVFMGIGVGLAIRGGCALDGIEVLALYTGKRISFTISEIILGINIIIFMIAAIKLGLPTALYSILTYYAASRTINFVIEGLEEYTGVTIISGQSAVIKERLVMELGRGITVYKGERGFLKGSFDVSQPVDIIFTVVTRLEVQRLRNMVHEIDDKAFIFTSSIKEAAGGVLKRRPRH